MELIKQFRAYIAKRRAISKMVHCDNAIIFINSFNPVPEELLAIRDRLIAKRKKVQEEFFNTHKQGISK